MAPFGINDGATTSQRAPIPVKEYIVRLRTVTIRTPLRQGSPTPFPGSPRGGQCRPEDLVGDLGCFEYEGERIAHGEERTGGRPPGPQRGKERAAVEAAAGRDEHRPRKGGLVNPDRLSAGLARWRWQLECVAIRSGLNRSW